MSKSNKSGENVVSNYLITGYRKRYKSSSNNSKVGGQNEEAFQKNDESRAILQNFKKYSQQLDQKHDKFERIVKLSRDITIESKRIIFLLHSIDRDSKKAAVLKEAESRLISLVSHQWRSIAGELRNEDPYLYHRAFSSGMQEFMEAFIFFYYLRDEKFPSWDYYQDKLKYSLLEKPDKVLVNCAPNSEIDAFVILVPIDFILGLADVTGELMKKCINNLNEGDVQECFKTCNFVKSLYSCFLTIGFSGSKEMSHKLYILRQSLLKMEMVCYNIHVRGSEIPKHMLADVDAQKVYSDEDEGFFG